MHPATQSPISFSFSPRKNRACQLCSLCVCVCVCDRHCSEYQGPGHGHATFEQAGLCFSDLQSAVISDRDGECGNSHALAGEEESKGEERPSTESVFSIAVPSTSYEDFGCAHFLCISSILSGMNSLCLSVCLRVLGSCHVCVRLCSCVFISFAYCCCSCGDVCVMILSCECDVSAL